VGRVAGKLTRGPTALERRSVQAILRFLKGNWFLFGIGLAVALGMTVPGLGRALNAGRVASTAAVGVIFVLSGLSLPSDQLRAGLRNVRVHVLLQAFIFLAVPAYFCLTAGWLRGVMSGHLILGVYALAVFPTTISSCIVFTQMARGNVAATIFNAVLANLLGVFVSPLLLTLLLRQAGWGLPMDEVARIFLDLALKVLLPFAAGQLLRLRLRSFADRNRRRFSTASACLILLIVFLAFCKAAGSDALRAGAGELAGPLAYLAGSNVLLMALAYGAGRLVGLGRADLASVIFTAPQKTLAMGIPLLTTYFASQPEVIGAAMIPALFYHPWQLLTAGVARSFVTVPESSSGDGGRQA